MYGGGWRPLPLWERLDEPTPDFVSSPDLPPDASFAVHLAPPSAPIAGPAEDARQPHTLVVRLDGTCCTSAVVALVDTVAGADRWVKSQRFCLEPGFRDYEMQLSYREAALIEDYSALKVVVMASGEAPGCSCSCPSSSSSSSESSSGSSSASSSSSGSSSSGPSSSESASSGSSSASSSGQGSSSGSNSASGVSGSLSSSGAPSGSSSGCVPSASRSTGSESSSGTVVSACGCPLPATLYISFTSTDCPALSGLSYTLTWNPQFSRWEYSDSSPSGFVAYSIQMDTDCAILVNGICGVTTDLWAANLVEGGSPTCSPLSMHFVGTISGACCDGKVLQATVTA